MSSLLTRLQRIHPQGSMAAGTSGGRLHPESSPTSAGPSLDDLRERVARILARGTPVCPTPRPDPTAAELPFLVERTAEGPLYVRRVRCLPGARVGRFPLHPAADADGGLLALLALDPGLATAPPRRGLYLDVETTGLAGGAGTVAFLVGLAWLGEGDTSFTVEQLLLRRLGEEGPILARLSERLAAASMVVTFNGKTFDWPLLSARYVMNRLTPPTPPPHLDLLHVARRVHRARLATRTLAAIERDVLGRVRVGDVSGGDIVAAYAHYLRSGDEEALLGVVSHNEADVLSMVALVGLYGEPIGAMDPVDLAGIAHTLRRARALSRASAMADEAVERGGGVAALRVRGDLAQARGDTARALADYEALAADVDDPQVRLALAKLYEHHVRAFDAALALCDRGTGEDAAAAERRRARLGRKLARQRERVAAQREGKRGAAS